jgi:5,5'-dehydrodivanillate O-demethylase
MSVIDQDRREQARSEPARASRAEIDIVRTGPGTPGGRFLRRFWTAIHRSEDLASGQAKPLRIMSEDYTLYRGQAGRAQVIDQRCPHRGALLHLGWVEGDDIRCVYHGWKFDCTGQCLEQPAEEPGFARKVKMRSYPTREYLGLVYAYFGEGEPPAFPPYPGPVTAGFIDVWNPETVPCNYLQSYENTMDEVHVAFVHRPGGSHAKIFDLPIITAEETEWGMIRYGTRKTGKVRVTLHYAPNVTRVMVPPLVGMEWEGGWVEIFFNLTPIDDENHLWLVAAHVPLTGAQADAYRVKRAEYSRKVAATAPARHVALELIEGKHRYADVRHPDLAVVQDIATQAGQGRFTDREHEHLGRSDTGIILWRKILHRELRALAEGRAPKAWTVAPAEVVPTLGF